MSGEVIVGYESLATIWGQIRPLTGREFFAAQQIQADVTTEIRIRYRTGIDSTIRILHRPSSRVGQEDAYDVVAALEDDASGIRELKLMCVRRTADGTRRGGGV